MRSASRSAIHEPARDHRIRRAHRRTGDPAHRKPTHGEIHDPRFDRAAGVVAAACPACRDGDLLVSTEALTLAVGDTHRPVYSFYGHETADAMGSILSFAAGRESGAEATLRSNLAVGSPYVRLDGKPIFFPYRSVELSRAGTPDARVTTAAMLNRGIYRPLVGSSDAHEIDADEPGYSRTWVLVERRNRERADSSAVMAAMRQRRSIVSNGPVVRVLVDGVGQPGDVHQVRNGRVEIAGRVQSAAWVAADSVELVVNGARHHTWVIPPRRGAALDWTGTLRLPTRRDAWVAAVVRGRRTLYPVVQAGATDGRGDGAPLPFAISNPVRLDVDGNGRFDAVRAEPIALRPR